MEKCGDFQAILGEKGGFRDWVLCVCRLRSGYFLVSGQHSGLPPACSQQREIIYFYKVHNSNYVGYFH